jgi:dihydropteroate synthase
MGVVNVTPDSFSDGGVNLRAEDAIASARRMAAEGAAIVDIGGESTRPGSEGISAEEELRRVEPVLEAVAGELPVSIDTSKAAVGPPAQGTAARVG